MKNPSALDAAGAFGSKYELASNGTLVAAHWAVACELVHTQCRKANVPDSRHGLSLFEHADAAR
jgi:hypothetical protein